MEQPSVVTTVDDPSSGVTYRVLAYRKLSREELLFAIASYNGRRKRHHKRGTVVTVVSIIGFDGK